MALTRISGLVVLAMALFILGSLIVRAAGLGQLAGLLRGVARARQDGLVDGAYSEGLDAVGLGRLVELG